MQTNSDLIKNMGILAEEVYDNDNFLVGKPINADGTIYTVVATSDMPSGFQGMLLESGGKYVFAFRGTEGNHPISNFEQFYKDLKRKGVKSPFDFRCSEGRNVQP